MKEEDKIIKKVGRDNAFHVPNGYFDNLTSEVMNRLPEKETVGATDKEPTTWDKIRPWMYMAAMFIGAALIIRVASSGSPSESVPADQLASEETDTEMEYISSVIDNSMIDDYSLYVYMAEPDAE